jgi:hypothetical protein
LKVEVLGQRGIGKNLERNQILLNEFHHFSLGVRNRTHLLAANSMGVEKIEKNRLAFGADTGQRRIETGFPFDLFFHNCSSLLK